MPKDSVISHILGIDFGTAKVGLALADLETKIAFAYITLKNDENFLKNLTRIIEKESVGKIIIGSPGYLKQDKKEKPAEIFGLLIEKKFSEVSVEYQDEMFTTKMAQDNLIEKGMKRVGKIDDAESARIILQSWLDKSF